MTTLTILDLRMVAALASAVLAISDIAAGQLICPSATWTYSGGGNSGLRSAGNFDGAGGNEILLIRFLSASFEVLTRTPGGSTVVVYSGTLPGTCTGPNYGITPQGIAGVGDLDGDGFDDLAIGEWQHCTFGLPSWQWTGRVVVRRGGPSGGSQIGQMLYLWDGVVPGGRFGHAIASVGDANGDGVNDVLVGSNDSGRLYLFSGATGQLLFSTIQAAGFGRTVSPAGDVNADGVMDFMAGGTNVPGNPLIVFSGAGPAAPLGTVLFSQSVPNGSDYLSEVGDINSDGHDDIAVGNPYRMRVYSGVAPGHTILRERLCGCDWFRSFSGVGNIVGDAAPDIAIAINDGSPWGLIMISGSDGSECSTSTTGAFFGVSGFGDINGDGMPDFGAISQGQLTVFQSSAVVIPPFPGSQQDFRMLSAVGSGALTTYPNVKSVGGGSPLTLRLESSTAALYGQPIFLAAEAFATGIPPVPISGMPGLNLGFGITILVNGLVPLPGTPPGFPPLFPSLSPVGNHFGFVVPPGFSGVSVLFQGAVLQPLASPPFWFTDGHEIQLTS